MRFRGKVAVITGAGSGIGRASAGLFAQEGAKVVVVDWDRDKCQDAVVAILERGGAATPCFSDVSQCDDAERMINIAVENYGRIDILFNNAAVQQLGTLVDTSVEVWDQIHNVNLKGVFLGCKYAIPAMVKGGGGSIINMASVLGFVGDPDLTAYCAAKGGVIALTKSAAIAYGSQGVRVNCICPGDVSTPMVEAYFRQTPNSEQLRQDVYSKYALKRIAAPMEIAQVAAFLASDASSFLTGSSVVVDGGLTVKCY
ncbi:MAG: glucose 1-dehydrogenase [Acidobacteriota bacterium]